jgi:transcriptional regulator with XRE-family HTH domain
MRTLGSATDRLSDVLRSLRVAARLSLDDAAHRVGISRRSLIALEHGHGNPSLSTLLRLAEGYGVGLADLLGDFPHREIMVRGEAEARTLWRSEGGSEARLLIASPELELWRWHLAPGDARASEPHRRGTTEIIDVLQGRLTLTVAGDDRELGAADVALFAGDELHCMANPGPAAAEFALVVHEPRG